MYFWNIESLKDEIKKGELKDDKVLPYILWTMSIYFLCARLLVYFPNESTNQWDYLQFALDFIITIAGTVYIYRKNGGAEGSNFASKYFSISFVVGFRFFIYLMLLMSLMFVYWSFTFDEQESFPTTPFEVFVFSMWYLVLYLRIAKHIGETVEE